MLIMHDMRNILINLIRIDTIKMTLYGLLYGASDPQDNSLLRILIETNL